MCTHRESTLSELVFLPQQRMGWGGFRMKPTVIPFFSSEFVACNHCGRKFVLILLLNQMDVQRAERALNRRDTCRSSACLKTVNTVSLLAPSHSSLNSQRLSFLTLVCSLPSPSLAPTAALTCSSEFLVLRLSPQEHSASFSDIK